MVIFLAGLSGSGKTVAATTSGAETVISLDSFFFNDHPSLPKWMGRTDWETMGSFDLDAAVSAVLSLAAGIAVRVPLYDHRGNSAVGSSTLAPSGSIVAEGVYAPTVYKHVRATGVKAALLLLDVSAGTAFLARLRRDIGERHMSPLWAIMRSARLFARHRHYRRQSIALGAEVVGRDSVVKRVGSLVASS